MSVEARNFIRRVRGGSQPHLIEADDAKFYIVKFRNNPQHQRILVNEMLAYHLLDYLQIAAPKCTIVNVSEEFIRENELSIELGNSRIPVQPGLHFGSCHPGSPYRLAVFDMLPDTLISKLENIRDFLGILAFDKWLSNADSRQCLFLRGRLTQFLRSTTHPLRIGFVALMVDHGYLFNGPQWCFTDSAVQGLYFRTLVYESVRGFDDFQPWLDRIVHLPEKVLDDAVKSVPVEWLNGDGDDFERLLEQLLKRRRRVPDAIDDCRRGPLNPFPNWKR